MVSELQEMLEVKNRILGVLISDARKAAGRSVSDCASLLGLSDDAYEAFEKGHDGPSLPQLEVLAYVFNVPIEHFWGADTLSAQHREENIKNEVPELLLLRQKVVGVKLRQLRDKAGLSIKDLADKVNMVEGDIAAIENGSKVVPVNELEIITRAINASLRELSDGYGPVGNWLQAKEDFDAFLELPQELRTFLLKPINRSYLDIARRLSEMDVSSLRSVGESILEITF